MYSIETPYSHSAMAHRANKLLAALAPDDFACLEPHLEIVKLRHGQVLCEVGEPLRDAYFPHNVIISLMAVMKNGRCAEMSIFGREGVTGLTAAAITNQAFGRYVVQLTGTASRITVGKLHEVIGARPNIQRLMRCFMEALMSHVLQNVACNAIHSVEARCARLILSTRHQVTQEIMPLTHEFGQTVWGSSAQASVLLWADFRRPDGSGRAGEASPSRMRRLLRMSHVNATKRSMRILGACCLPLPQSAEEKVSFYPAHGEPNSL
jgi:CRP-like cAMP-binding protein